ncbi:RNA-guided endonuclease InsQ/TnpB family protein [Streptomyces hydrogenans]|uniref:RNA-guided endonuclease InsQ/TnpB family protein n=1 Tax=Streptomyces hydrogenans TaxID=1873719 RepID=UPI0036415316
MVETGVATRRFTGHRARLELSAAQADKAETQAHAARGLWNLLHAWWQMMPREKRTLAHADAAIREGRKEIHWLGALPAQAAQQVLKAYARAWQNHWAGRAEAPKYKHRSRSPLSVDIPQGAHLQVVRVHRRWGMASIPKIGRVRFRWTRELPVGRRAGQDRRITGARLIRDALGWHLAFRVQACVPTPPPHPGPAVGIDLGVTVPLALSDGTVFRHGPWLTVPEQAKLLRLQRRAAHRRSHHAPGLPPSRRLGRTYDQIATLRAKAKRRALDWQHKTTTTIAATYSTVVFEDLAIANMVRSARGTKDTPGTNVAQKAGLNRVIHGEAWGRTVALLSYKTDRSGGALFRVAPQGTSQRCSACGHTTRGSRESQAVFVCKNPECGWAGNADHNASRNVLHLYRIGLVAVPAAGRAVVRRARRVKPVVAR